MKTSNFLPLIFAFLLTGTFFTSCSDHVESAVQNTVAKAEMVSLSDSDKESALAVDEPPTDIDEATVTKTDDAEITATSTNTTSSSNGTRTVEYILPRDNENGKDYYVSASRGKGRKGTIDQPAKDLAAIAGFLEAGDRVHIAQGIYTSKTDRGTDIINVPISVYGGYSDDFQSRDPWGTHRSVLTGTNDYATSETTERLAILTDKKFRNWEGTIVVDGIIVDNGPRNRYKTEKRQLLLRKASATAGAAATPGHAGIKVRVGAKTNVEVVNCVVINTASSQGSIEVQLGTNGKGFINNNLLVNNTGEGIYCKTNSHAAKDMAEFKVTNNTILFNWTADAIASYGGSSLMMDAYCIVTAENNVFGFADQGGVNNIKKCKDLRLNNNLFFGHGMFDYREFRSDMPLAELEDYAEFLNPNSEGNFSKEVNLPTDESWANLYFGRTKITRAAVDAEVKVSNSDANQLRSILGLPVRGGDVSMDAEVWLHQMDLDAAIKLGLQSYEGVGCQGR